MTFKSIVKAMLVLCITAILAIAVCGCEDLGAYEDTAEYYNSFGDIVLISEASKEGKKYSVEEYFYNKESREDFLVGEDGSFQGIQYGEYVYMAIPFESDINMDTIALYLQSQTETTVYISVFLSDEIPSNWKSLSDVTNDQEGSGESQATEETEETEEITYDDPDPESRIGEVTVHLNQGKWDSFVLDYFKVNGTTQSSIQINDGQYILLQFRNNSGVRVFDEDKQVYVDPITGLELPKAEITMTNLLIRALEIKNEG